MFEAFLANTSTQSLSPLGTAPQRSYELISGTVRDRLSARHAALFAEPVGTQHGDRFDWYAALDGKPAPLDSFDEQVKADVMADLASLISEIGGLGQSLLESGNPDEQRLGEALTNAVRYPGADCIYVVEDGAEKQPVLLNWAWVSDTQAAVVGDLSGSEGATRRARPVAAAAATELAAAAPVPPMPRDDMPTRSGFSLWWLIWLGWLLLLILLAAILFLMVETCALRIPGLPQHCPLPTPVASDELRNTSWLRDRIATVERQIGIADRACQPEHAEITPVPDPLDEIDQRLAERGAQKGDLTFSLIWDGPDDLDLYVTCPTGQTVYYRNQNACGGTLDVDSNAGSRMTSNPVENTFFNGPQGGAYQIRVNLYAKRAASSNDSFQLRIFDHGRVETLNGTVSRQQPNWTHSYRTGGN